MTSLKALHDKHLVLKPEPGSFTAQGDSSRWSNKDLDPVPASKRTWEWWQVSGFWIGEGFNAAQMQTASSAVALGLNPGLAVAACLVGNLLVTPPVCIMGYLGAKTGLNFPVLARGVFGMWGSYVALVIRGVFCLILYGVIATLGGGAVQCMVEAIWPSFANWHVHSLPASSAITAQQLLCFAIFWLLSLPFLLVSISSLRWLFTVKIVLMPFFYVALFTWSLTASHGVGPLFSIPNNITGGLSIGYVFCATTLATIGANATFAVNMADITRYAKQPRASAIAQAVALPLCITLTELLGALLAATSQVLYGKVLWNPTEIILLWDNRAPKFFAGFLFALAMLATNVSGNSVPFANDLSAAFPKYINFRRGQLICACIGFACNPWLIEAKAATFFNFIGGYSTFLGPLVGVMLCDYLLVRKGKAYDIVQLYKPHGRYWFFHGVNIRALVALFLGMTPQLPGLAYAISPTTVHISMGEKDFYTFSWLDGLVFAMIIYYALYRVFPFELSGNDEVYEGTSVEVQEQSFEKLASQPVGKTEV
ncbi:hypothetical protein ANO11243_060620 [Dothideomycetidae sp. 11243]|nr:hypothetical protein ANO11243_060620 [fungal sp. No.11243]